MIYPKKINARKTGVITKSLMLATAILAIILIIINKLTTPDIHWGIMTTVGLIYVWVTVMYSINRNINIAAHVMIQTIAISVFMFAIDYWTDGISWSLNIAIPIIIIIANTTMLILTIISHRRFIRYAIYQLIILLFSTLPVLFIYEKLIVNKWLSYMAIGVSILNFILTASLCAKDIKDEIVRKFHI